MLFRSYKQAKNSAYEVTGLVAVLAVLVFFLGKTRRSGLRVNAWLFGLAGAWALILGAAFKFGSESLINLAVQNTNNDASANTLGNVAVASAFNQVTTTLFKWHMIVGGSYVVVMVACVVLRKISKKKDGADKEAGKPVAPVATDSSPKTPTENIKKPAPAPKPQPQKPVKKTTLVQ